MHIPSRSTASAIRGVSTVPKVRNRSFLAPRFSAAMPRHYVQAVLNDSYRRFRRLSILLHANPTIPRNEEILSPNRVCQPEAASSTDANISAPTPQESSSAHMNRLELDVDPPPALFALKAGKVAGRPAGEETKESVKALGPQTDYSQSAMKDASARTLTLH